MDSYAGISREVYTLLSTTEFGKDGRSITSVGTADKLGTSALSTQNLRQVVRTSRDVNTDAARQDTIVRLGGLSLLAIGHR